jgi:hypothetical protein
MNQIIGGYKEFIVIKRDELDILEKKVQSERTGEMTISVGIYTSAVLDTIKWIKENNIYNQEFEIKK